jgi:GT2 family glycosyltransferase
MILDFGIRTSVSLIFGDYFMTPSPVSHTISPSGTATIAVVILNWNGRGYLERFLPSVLGSSYPDMEVIVADNASTDDSIRWLGETYPQIRVIALDRNYGFAGGYNTALRQVESDYYVLLNSDVEVEPGWIEPIMALMESDPSIGACQPKIRMWADRDTFEYAGAAGGWMDHLGYPFAKGRVFDTCEKDKGQYDTVGPVFWASGAALFVRGELYHRLGGLDSYFFAHMEEIDFCWRLQLAGYQVYTCPKSIVYHVGGGTLPKGNERKVFLNFRNNLIMLAKNLPVGQLVWKIPFRLAMDGLSAWKFLFSGQASYFWPVVKAHFAFYRWLLTGRKSSVFPPTRRGKLNGWYPHSVAWQYFISGKKTFSEIMKGKN